MEYKKIYNDFFKKHGKEIHADPTRFIAISKLCKGNVLDVGCGTGDLADFYKGNYTGIDVSDVAIEMAKASERKMVNFIVGDVTKSWVTPTNKADTVVMAEFLEHIKDDKMVFKNIKKWAKKDARLIITVPNGDRVPDINHLRQFTIPQLRKRFSKLGMVKVHNWSGARNRILLTVDLGKKNENLLSVVMVVKNEEFGLERAVLSCIEFVDNVVISVDYFSEDNTLEIAKLYADELKRHEWKDDFSAIRNSAQEGVKTKWSLALDGHEYVKRRGNLAEMLKLNVEGLFVTVEMDAGDKHTTNRIYRSHLKWYHAIHNAMRTKTNKKFKGFVVKHERKKGQSKKSLMKRKKQRDEMMPRLLRKEIKKNKGNIRALWYLARFFISQRKFKKTIKWYKKYLKKKGPKGERWLACLESSIAANCLGKHLLALNFLRKADIEIPNRWEISKERGLTYMNFS